LVDLLPLALLGLASVCNVYIYNLSVYLRAHKQEPFLNISIINGILTGLSTYFLGREYGILGMTAGYLFTSIVCSIIPGTLIFINKRKNWHT
jgi:O-antigen/teichoic acid export membrane protein